MSVVHDSVSIQAAAVALDADVVVPESAAGAVLFAHGSGSGRHVRRGGESKRDSPHRERVRPGSPT